MPYYFKITDYASVYYINHSMCCMTVFTICGIICWNNEEICRNNGLKRWEQKNRIMGNFIGIIGSSLQVATTSTGLGMRLTIHNIVFVPCTSVCSSDQLIQPLLAHAWTIGQTTEQFTVLTTVRRQEVGIGHPNHIKSISEVHVV